MTARQDIYSVEMIRVFVERNPGPGRKVRESHPLYDVMYETDVTSKSKSVPPVDANKINH
jgi:hypothetical protein